MKILYDLYQVLVIINLIYKFYANLRIYYYICFKSMINAND
jgi:hypothetical protein